MGHQVLAIFDPFDNSGYNSRKEAAFDKAKELGFNWVRFDFGCNQITGTTVASRDYTYLDEFMEWLLEKGMNLQFELTGNAINGGADAANKWYSKSPKSIHANDLNYMTDVYMDALDRVMTYHGLSQDRIYACAANEPGNLSFGSSVPGFFPDDTTTYSGTAYVNKNRAFWNLVFPTIRSTYSTLNITGPSFEIAATTTITTGATNATQTVASTAGMRVGDTVLFETSGNSGKVLTINSATSVTFTASIATTTSEVVALQPNWNIITANLSLDGSTLDAHWAAYNALDFHMYPNFGSHRKVISPEEVGFYVDYLYDLIDVNINQLSLSGAIKTQLLALNKTFSEVGFDYNSAGMNQTSRWSKWGNEKMRGKYISAMMQALNRRDDVDFVCIYNALNVSATDDNRSNTQHYGLCNYNGDINNAGAVLAKNKKRTDTLTLNTNNPSTAT